MIRIVRRWLVAVAIVAGFGTTASCRGDDSNASDPVPAPRSLPGSARSAGVEALPLASQQPPAYVLPPCGWPKVDFARPDPLLDRPYSAQPGCYANVEANVLWVHLRNQLAGPVNNPVAGTQDRVAFPGNKLDPAVSPRVELGYRFEDNWGSVQMGYRNLATRGRDQTFTNPQDAVQAPVDQVGRLDYNAIDLSYVSREYSLDPNWNMRWGAGPRLLFLYFDSRVRVLGAGADAGTILAQSETTSLTGYGMGAFLDLERHTPIRGLNVFGRIEGTDYYARTQQTYAETVAGGPGAGARASENRFTGSVGVSNLRGVIGVSYEVPEWSYARFLLGYQYETYFQVGRLSAGGIDTRGQLDLQGLFLRAEINF